MEDEYGNPSEFSIPLFVCYMRDKCQATYVKVYTAILNIFKEEKIDIESIFLITDCEISLYAAFEQVFKSYCVVQHQLCSVHYQ